MALVLKDRVKETSTTAGTGTLTLAGAVAGFQSFAAVGNGNTTYYAISDSITGDWEVGIGTYTSSGTTLSRTTVLSSSNGGSLVNFAANAKDVFVTYPSSRSAYQNEAGTQVVQTAFGAITATSAALTTGTITTAPVSNTDIVNKQYADAIASGIHFHEAVELATTAALPANTYNNGASGVGATLTANANGALTVDSVLTVVGYRVLVKNQVTQANNGVYTVTQVGSAGTPYILTRATDFDTAGSGVNQIDEGDFFLVTSGTVNANTAWVQQTPPPIVVGTTAIVFQQFAAPITYTAGTGLTESPTYTFNIGTTGVTATTYGSASQVPVFAVNAQGQLTSVTNTAIAINGSAVTGAITGQAGSVANALTAGTYLTSAGTYDGSAARTFAVDATSTNTVSKVVARDVSGNFAAGTITAALTGNATTATTATNTAGGAANQISYNTAAGTTSYIVAPTTAGTYLNWTGSAFAYSAISVPNALTMNNGGAGAVSGTTFNGSAAQTISYNTIGASPLAGSTSLTTTGTVTTGTWSGLFGAVTGANLTNLTAGNLAGTIPSAVLGNSTAYVGTTAVALNRASANQALTGILSTTMPGATSGSVQVIPAAIAGTGTVFTLPATTGTAITTGDTGTVTNTMLAGSIADTKLSTISTALKVSNSATTATNANTASAIVARDASGNFSAGTITATLSGSATSAGTATTATTATNIAGGVAGAVPYQSGAGATGFSAAGTSGQVLTSSGTTAPTWTTAASANTASAIVQRDASGNFSAGTITAALSGNASTATSATSATSATTATTATNLAGGAAGTIPYQSAAGTTVQLTAGTAGYILQANGAAAPSWVVASTAAGVNNGTLTMNVSGTGLSGSQTFTANQSSAATFTVTSNATNLNTASTIVARDASGNFTAGTVTAALSGNATTATTATNQSGGTVAATTGSFSGAITSSVGGSAISFTGATSNSILWNTLGVAAPTFTTRSVGAKLVIYPSLSVSATDYAIGIDSSTFWSSVDTTSASFKWYGGTTLAATLTGAGALSLTSTVTATSFSGAGTGLTGTASSLSIGGNAATATSATTATTANATNTSNNFQMNSLGVGTAGSGTAGEIRATASVVAFYSSDIKFKENVRDIPNAAATVKAIGGKLFDWKDDYIEEHGGEDGYFVQKADFGVIAQDVQAKFPVAVRTRPDGSLAVDYEKLSALALAAIAEQEDRITKLEALVAKLIEG